MESTTTAPGAAPAAIETVAAKPVATVAPAMKAAEAGTEQLAPGAAAEAKPQENTTWMLILVGVWVLFFFFWRNNKKREKAQREKREQELNTIGKGDKVVTIGRIHGTVVRADEKTFTIKPDPNKDYTMTFDREALLRILNRNGENSESAPDLTQGDGR